MKRLLLLALAAGLMLPSAAQNAGRIYRTEAAPYDSRHDADARNRQDDKAYIRFEPVAATTRDGLRVAAQQIDIPYAWTDGCVYLHLENVGSAYTLALDGRAVAEVEDPATPAEFLLTPLVHEGPNLISLTLRPSRTPQLQEGTPPTERPRFADCYLYMQNRRSVADFTVALRPDSTRRFGILDLAVVVRNAYNYDELVTVGYDIYSPQGRLLDFSIVERTVAGRSADTLRFAPHVYGAYDNRWESDGSNPPLYRVMLFLRRDGAYKEYMPLRVGFRDVEFRDGRFYSFGRPLELREASCNAASDREATRARMVALKRRGVNTLRPDAPQPAWYYELCDELGLRVIDRANLNAPRGRGDRTVGGTPSNDPALAAEYLERVKAMYYRSRNYTCVIAYELGGASGNGYNMYKAYQWLKSVERSRPVLYGDAAGEWNSDL